MRKKNGSLVGEEKRAGVDGPLLFGKCFCGLAVVPNFERLKLADYEFS